MMAKSTLCKYLRSLRKSGLIDKAVSKNRRLGPHDAVYVLTSKGKKIYQDKIGAKPIPFENFF